MAKLYNEHILGIKPPEGGIVSVADIRPASNNADSPIDLRQEEREADLVAGD